MSSEKRSATGSQMERSGSDKSFRLLAESVEEFALILLDRHGAVASWNPSAARLTGYRREEIVGKHFSCLHTSEDIGRKTADAEIESAGKDGRFECEGWRIRKDGSQFRAHVVLKALTDSDGMLTGFAKLVRDISVQGNTEEDLRKLNAEMERFFEMSLDMICVAGADGYFRKLNPAWERALGFSIAELLARPFVEFVHPDDRAGTLSVVKNLEHGVDVVNFENRLLHKDGSYRWLAWKAPAIPPGQDYLYASARDITEMRRAEEDLRGSQARLKLALDAAHIGDWELNLETHAARSSLKHDQIFGYDQLRPEWTYEVFLDHVHPEDRAFVDHAFKESIAAGTDWYFECRILRKDGVERHIWTQGGIYPDPSGHPTQMLGMVRDITDRKRNEAQITNLLQRLDLATRAAHLGIWDWDIVRNELVWDNRMYELYGVSRDTFGGAYDAWLKGVHPDDRARCDDAIQQALREEKEYDLAFRALWPDGTVRVIKADSQIVRDAAGKPIRMTGINYDITDRKLAEEELARLSQEAVQRATQLEAANKELEAFSYSVSHDLRAPLRHVQGYVGLLKKAAGIQLTEQARHHLEVISDASKQMGQLIDDLLTFSRIGRSEMHRETVNLNDLVQLSAQALDLETRDRKIVWKIAPLPAVAGDRAMLRQVFANLIGNAVKYTGPRDPAEIEIGCAGREDGRVIIFIKDNGVGFDMQFSAKLFGVFQRLHTMEEFEGTGIGLANVRRIITRHGGRIWPEAAVDRGATFFFTLEETIPAAQIEVTI
ncbi:MAG: PAS domain-containing protein [Chthoniobacteraceae bacterium]